MKLRHGPRIASALLMVLALAGDAAGWWAVPGLQRLERILYDIRLSAVATAVPEERLVIIDIDEASLREPEEGGEGRWPWPRERLALLIERLFREQGVAAIGLDIILSGRHPGDAALAQAMSLGPVVVGDAFHSGGGSSGEPPVGIDPTPWSGARVRIRTHDQSIGVVPMLRQAAAGSGHVHPLRDADGVTRRVPLFIEHRGRWHPALSLSLLQAWSDSPPPEPVWADYGGQRRIEAITVAGLQIPVDEDLQALVPYRAAGHPLPRVSAADILHQRVPKGAPSLEGRIVLVGASAAGLADLVTTPVQASLPGVQVHGQLLAGLLDARLPHEPPYARAVQWLWVVLAGGCVAVLGARVAALRLLLLAGVLLAGLVAGNIIMLHGQALVLPLAVPLLAVFLPALLHAAWGYAVESRSRRQITELFAHYVPPELVARMAENPTAYDMRPSERELTVLFADVRGFTGVSESLSPQQLADWINEYLTAMSLTLREDHHGTLDKYIGDAIMAFWGAPVEDAAHATRAVSAALAMQRQATRLSLAFEARGWPPLSIGVGLNTGLMRVGDMGSRVRRAYTVMGDSVNLASRLEGLTRVYGVGVLIGPGTRAQLPPQWVCREIDRVRVKGKLEPVSIHEPIGLRADLSGDQLQRVDRWHQMLAHIRAQQWGQATKALEDLEGGPADPGASGSGLAERTLLALYRQRLQRWQQEPPGPAWDGVTTFEVK